MLGMMAIQTAFQTPWKEQQQLLFKADKEPCSSNQASVWAATKQESVHVGAGPRVALTARAFLLWLFTGSLYLLLGIYC